jgi:hypothetical protein
MEGKQYCDHFHRKWYTMTSGAYTTQQKKKSFQSFFVNKNCRMTKAFSPFFLIKIVEF